MLYFALLATGGLLQSQEFRFNDGEIAYETFSDKGLKGSSLIPKDPFRAPRERPLVRYLPQGPSPDKAGNVESERVPVRLEERAGESRQGADVSFGFPLAQGALFDLGKLRVMDDASRAELPIQVTALVLWPDGSIKSAFIQFETALEAGKSRAVSVEFGNAVSRAKLAKAPLRLVDGKDSIKVATGAIETVVSKARFIPFQEVMAAAGKRLIAKSTGVEIKDESGAIFSTAFAIPTSVRIERQGSFDAVLRVEGKFGDQKSRTFMRYIARLRFVAESSRVDLTFTTINDELGTEFTDFRGLGLGLSFPDAKSWQASLSIGPDAFSAPGDSASVQQIDENTILLKENGRSETKAGRAQGVAKLQMADEAVWVGVRDFWQRWPKGLVAQPQSLRIDLLPEQSSGYGNDLPYHLLFPFVDGCYRMKWGMAFTERMSFDFSAARASGDLAADLNSPVIAIIPPAYLGSTGVFGAIATEGGPASDLCDAFMETSLEMRHIQRDQQREYGFLNWGDWFGERGHNWGNNEYDTAHGYFSNFLRTGDSRYFDDGVLAARHQADVDIVHAYPDPFYIGANPQHSIGHTGISYQKVTPKTWTYKYDAATSAGNGHTWSEGMADSWLLTGDPVVMESLLALGEHITWAFAPSFKKLGALERSGGWSLIAALGAYRATSDPAYLNAASEIVKMSIKDFDENSGIWPHELPPTHALGKTGVIGNSLYNIGILMMGFAEYHQVTQDPEVLKILKRANEWVTKSFDPKGLAWPYSAGVQGERFTAANAPNLNALIFPALAYTGLITQDVSFLQIANEAFLASYPPGGATEIAKEFSIKMHAPTETLAFLEQARRANLLQSTGTPMEKLMDRESRNKFVLKSGGGDLAFRIVKLAPQAKLSVRRTSKVPVEGSIQLTSATDEVIPGDASGKLPDGTSKSDSFEWTLPGDSGGTWTLAIKGLPDAIVAVEGDGVGIDYLPSSPLTFWNTNPQVAYLRSTAGSQAVLHLGELGAGALLQRPEGGFEESTVDLSKKTKELRHQSSGENPAPAKVVLWDDGKAAVTVSLSGDEGASLRLVGPALDITR